MYICMFTEDFDLAFIICICMLIIVLFLLYGVVRVSATFYVLFIYKNYFYKKLLSLLIKTWERVFAESIQYIISQIYGKSLHLLNFFTQYSQWIFFIIPKLCVTFLWPVIIAFSEPPWLHSSLLLPTSVWLLPELPECCGIPQLLPKHQTMAACSRAGEWNNLVELSENSSSSLMYKFRNMHLYFLNR